MERDAQPTDDGLATPEIGAWGKRKYHFLRRFLQMFTKGMPSHWGELHYVDLFAGAGLARVRSTGELVETSALIAAGTQRGFTKLHLCDSDRANVNALGSRLVHLTDADRVAIYHGDANALASEIVQKIPTRDSLAVTLLDPFSLKALDFRTVRTIASRRSDLIVLVPDSMDAARNMEAYYALQDHSNLDRFLGTTEWRPRLLGLTGSSFREALRTFYSEQLQSLGYRHFGYRSVELSPGQPIYSLLFASRHPRGKDYWEKACSVGEDGQRELWS